MKTKEKEVEVVTAEVNESVETLSREDALIANLSPENKAKLDELKATKEAKLKEFEELKKVQNEKLYLVSKEKEVAMYIRDFVTKRVRTTGLEAKGLYLIYAAIQDSFSKFLTSGEFNLLSTDIQALWYFVQKHECDNVNAAEKFTFGALEPLNSVLPEVSKDVEALKPFKPQIDQLTAQISALLEGIDFEKLDEKLDTNKE